MTYRYRLTRDIEPDLTGGYSGNLLWIMLNPSTADEKLDDPTIRRVKGFTARLGFSQLTVVNLYGLRATSPADLWTSDDPIGPENDLFVKQAVLHAAYLGSPIIAAWGALARPKRVEEVLALIRGVRAMALLSCLGTTNSGAPRHPLYVRSDTPLVQWPVASWARAELARSEPRNVASTIASPGVSGNMRSSRTWSCSPTDLWDLAPRPYAPPAAPPLLDAWCRRHEDNAPTETPTTTKPSQERQPDHVS